MAPREGLHGTKTPAAPSRRGKTSVPVSEGPGQEGEGRLGDRASPSRGREVAAEEGAGLQCGCTERG